MEGQEKDPQKIKEYGKSVQKEPTVKRCLLIVDLMPEEEEENLSIDRKVHSLVV